METKNIILVDDHVVVRNGLKELIQKLGPYTISYEFDSGSVFLNSFPFKHTPDLIVLDYNLPGMNGEEILDELNKLSITTPILMLTLNADENTIIRLFRKGARGYLRKDCSAKILQDAIGDILRSGYYHNEFLSLSIRNNEGVAKKTEQEKILEQLTVREREFLKLVCHEKEYTYEQIADQMKVQHRTVDGYREAVFDKFAIKSKTGLVLFVLKHNLFDVL